MANVSIARRYAKALLDVAGEGAALDAVSQKLAALATVFQSPELRDVANNPAYSRAQRVAVVEGVLKAAGESTSTLANLLRLLVERSRLVYLPDIARLFRDMADTRSGRVRAKVTTAVALTGDALERLERTLERVTQRNVVLESKVDPDILGGASAQVGSYVYDGSIRSQLEDLRRTLKS